ncbi:mannose receptor, C type [Mytilus galloprovincialis]|uniref:Mannose receptor, C type n=1 Tax=Mytilus galloprovincialis TaxID=29158 RepID=A0A8B6D9I1_MYTGA|nr:mannose receptor, C type [Mytilus galloprovincialis]
MSLYNILFYCCLCLICQTSGEDSVDTGLEDPYILCEGQDNTIIECPAAKVIKIEAAIYGRTDKSVCQHDAIKSTSCKKTVTSIVQTKCNFKQTCFPISSNDIYGDPCTGTSKYLNVSYRCIKDEQLSSKPLTHLTTPIFTASPRSSPTTEQQELFSTTDAQPSLKSTTHLPTQFFTASPSSSSKTEQQVSFSKTGVAVGISVTIAVIIVIVCVFIILRKRKSFSMFCFARKVPYAIKHDEQDHTEIQNVAYTKSNTSNIEGNDINYTTLKIKTDDHNYTELRNSQSNEIENHTIEADSYLTVCNSFDQNTQSSTTDATYEEVRQKGSTQIVRQTRETHHDYLE